VTESRLDEQRRLGEHVDSRAGNVDEPAACVRLGPADGRRSTRLAAGGREQQERVRVQRLGQHLLGRPWLDICPAYITTCRPRVRHWRSCVT